MQSIPLDPLHRTPRLRTGYVEVDGLGSGLPATVHVGIELCVPFVGPAILIAVPDAEPSHRASAFMKGDRRQRRERPVARVRFLACLAAARIGVSARATSSVTEATMLAQVASVTRQRTASAAIRDRRASWALPRGWRERPVQSAQDDGPQLARQQIAVRAGALAYVLR